MFTFRCLYLFNDFPVSSICLFQDLAVRRFSQTDLNLIHEEPYYTTKLPVTLFTSPIFVYALHGYSIQTSFCSGRL